MTRVILHTPGGRTVTMHPRTKSNDGLHVFLHRARTRDSQITITGDPPVVGKLYRGKKVKAVRTEGNKHTVIFEDSAGAGLVGGGNRPEGRHARRTPIKDHSYRVSQIQGEETGVMYEIWEGAGVNGGDWFVKKRGTIVYKSSSRRDAEDWAEHS